MTRVITGRTTFFLSFYIFSFFVGLRPIYCLRQVLFVRSSYLGPYEQTLRFFFFLLLANYVRLCPWRWSSYLRPAWDTTYVAGQTFGVSRTEAPEGTTFPQELPGTTGISLRDIPVVPGSREGLPGSQPLFCLVPHSFKRKNMFFLRKKSEQPVFSCFFFEKKVSSIFGRYCRGYLQEIDKNRPNILDFFKNLINKGKITGKSLKFLNFS